MNRNCEANVFVEAPPSAVWEVVSDVTRVGEWSGECRGCSWVGQADSASPGARFRGRNRRGSFRWTRLNEVIQADAPHRLVWKTIARPPYPDSVEWELTLVPHGDGTLVTESFRVLKIPRLMEWFIGLALPAHRDRTSDLAEDLDRLKAVVDSAMKAATS